VQAGLRLSTGVELTERDAPANRAQLELAEAALREAFPVGGLSGPDWLGSRPTLPDCRPMIGEAPRHPGLWLAFGHQHIGLSTGPGTAQVLASLMLREQSPIDARPFRAERFIA
jgi:D-amino-acid dehydrogenase